MRTARLIIAAAVVASACSDVPSRMTSPPQSTVDIHPPLTIFDGSGNPTPGASDRLLVDTRSSLQQAGSLAAAWALFPGNDHSPSSASDGTGWAFSNNFDGQGTHALRADWQADPGCSEPVVRVIDYLPPPQPKQLFVQWRQYLGRHPRDPGGLGVANAFRITNPSCVSGGRQELRALRTGVGGGGANEIDLLWSTTETSTAAPNVRTATASIPGNQGWSFSPEANTGRPITITVYLQAASAKGAANGVVQVWIDGRLFLASSRQALGQHAFDRFELPSMFAGPPQDESEYFWDVVAWQPASGGTGGTPSVRVTPATATIDPGKTVQLTATVRDGSGNVVTGQPVTWTTSNAAAATVDANGLVTGVASGSATIAATSGGASGSAAITVKSTQPPPPNGTPAPGPGATIIQDTRAALQSATTKDQAFAIFGIVDHTPYRGARNTGGWSFTTNADGNGLHALRADWEQSTSNDQGIRVIDYLPSPKPTEMYVQWKARVGRYAFDTDANGNPDSYTTYPQSNSCKRALFSQASNNRLDYTLARSLPEVARIENGPANFAMEGDASVWNFNQEVGAAPYTTTVHIKNASTTGKNDGVYQFWINGTMIFDIHNLPADATAFDRWEFPATCTVVSQPQADYFWDFLIWKP